MKNDQVYEIDEQGFIIGILILEFDVDGHPLEELATNIVIIRPPDGLFRPRWTGEKWIEDKTQEEFDYEQTLEALKPSPEAIKNAEFELKVLKTIMEVGLV